MAFLRQMTNAEYAAWRAEVVPAYAADKIASGQWAEDEALQLSAKEYEKLLPQGLDTPENHLYAVLDQEGANVGMLWFAVQKKFNTRVAYVFDIGIHEKHRRQGHGARAFRELEGEVQRLGLAGIALHVFGRNTGARALYAKLGYQPTNITLYKQIGGSDA